MHVLINQQLRQTFDDVEKSTGVQLITEREISIQVKTFAYHKIFTLFVQENLLTTIFPPNIAQAIKKELYADERTKYEVVSFRQLHIQRFENVRYCITSTSVLHLVSVLVSLLFCLGTNLQHFVCGHQRIYSTIVTTNSTAVSGGSQWAFCTIWQSG